MLILNICRSDSMNEVIALNYKVDFFSPVKRRGFSFSFFFFEVQIDTEEGEKVCEKELLFHPEYFLHNNNLTINNNNIK